MNVGDENIEKDAEETVEQVVPEFTVKVADDFVETPITEEVVEEVVEEVIKETVEEVVVEQPVVTEEVEISDEKVLSYLKGKGVEVENLEALKPRTTSKLSPEIEKFIEFQEKTGNANYSDFLATQKDWKSENHDVVLKELMKIENPTLDADDINHLFEKKYVFDEDIDEEYDIKDKKIQAKIDLQRALNTLEKRKEEYMAVKGFDENVPAEFKEAKSLVDRLKNEQVENEKVAVARRNEFVDLTDKAFEQITNEGFKVKIGENEYPIKPQNASETKALQSDIANFQKKFFDQNGKLIDPVGYHKALYFAMNVDSVSEHIFNLGVTSYAEKEEIESKNIPEYKRQQFPNNKGTGITVKVVG